MFVTQIADSLVQHLERGFYTVRHVSVQLGCQWLINVRFNYNWNDLVEIPVIKHLEKKIQVEWLKLWHASKFFNIRTSLAHVAFWSLHMNARVTYPNRNWASPLRPTHSNIVISGRWNIK